MKKWIGVSLFFGISASGCVEPPYRYEVHDTGEGSVRIDRVEKTPAPAAAAPPANEAQIDQQRIDQLQAQVRDLAAENQKLKQAATAASK